jgi:hypothetical protein
VTTPQPQPPGAPVDTGNPLLNAGPAQCNAALVQTAAGQQLALTVRTTSATVTVFLSKDDAITWASLIRDTAKRMSGSGLIVAAPGNGAVPQVRG